MSRDEILKRIVMVFRDVFDDDGIQITEKTTAADIEDWDSLTHITLISSVEEEFDIRFEMREVISFKNVGDMLSAIGKEV